MPTAKKETKKKGEPATAKKQKKKKRK